jgi:hypothetical protein
VLDFSTRSYVKLPGPAAMWTFKNGIQLVDPWFQPIDLAAIEPAGDQLRIDADCIPPPQWQTHSHQTAVDQLQEAHAQANTWRKRIQQQENQQPGLPAASFAHVCGSSSLPSPLLPSFSAALRAQLLPERECKGLDSRLLQSPLASPPQLTALLWEKAHQRIGLITEEVQQQSLPTVTGDASSKLQFYSSWNCSGGWEQRGWEEDKSDWKKNYMSVNQLRPCEQNFFVVRFFPLVVLRCTLEGRCLTQQDSVKASPGLVAKHWRGSSSFVPVATDAAVAADIVQQEGLYLGVIHERLKRTHYVHRFVLLAAPETFQRKHCSELKRMENLSQFSSTDVSPPSACDTSCCSSDLISASPLFSVVAYSPAFHFLPPHSPAFPTTQVEFGMSLVLESREGHPHEGHLLISYGKEDTQAWITRVHISSVIHALQLEDGAGACRNSSDTVCSDAAVPCPWSYAYRRRTLAALQARFPLTSELADDFQRAMHV